MKIKLFVIAAAIAALMSPLVASAANAVPAIPFGDLSSIDYGITGTAKTAKFTLIDLNSKSKRVSETFMLQNGTLDPASSAEFIFDKKSITLQDSMPGLKINIDETIDYDIGQATLFASLLSAGPRSKALSGPGGIDVRVPSNANFVYSGLHPTGVFSTLTGVTSKSVTGYQYGMSGAVRVTAVVQAGPASAPASAKVAIGAIKPGRRICQDHNRALQRCDYRESWHSTFFRSRHEL